MIEDLKKFAIFSDWSVEELGEIVPYLKEEKIEKNTALFKQGAILGTDIIIYKRCGRTTK